MMRNYVILSDSACDIPQKLLDEWKVRICTLSHRYDDGTEERLSSGEVSVRGLLGYQ